MYRIFFKGFLVLIFFSNSIFLNAQIVGVFIHIEPSFFINVGRVDSSLYLLNNVKKETQKLTKINDDVEFSHKIINYFDSSGNKILQNYFLNDSLKCYLLKNVFISSMKILVTAMISLGVAAALVQF